MQLNFTINRIVAIPNAEATAKVVSVVDAANDDITAQFLRFCRENDLPLSSESEIDSAALAYGRKYYP